MAKISTYPSADVPLQLSDRLIGTEAIRPIPSPTPLATKNFSLGELLQLFSANFPAASLQAVLNTGNTATQNISLTGTIDVTLIKPDNIEDTSGSQGTVFQYLSKGTSSINWVDLPVDNLQAVLNAGNTATQSITLVGNITSTKIIPGNIQDDTSGIGTTGQLLSKTASGIRWINNPILMTPGLADVLSVGNTATNNINLIGNYYGDNFYTNTGGFGLMDDGTLLGQTFQFVNSFGSYLYTSSSSLNTWELPNQSGTIALVSDIPPSTTPNLNDVLLEGNTSLLDAKIGELYLYDNPNVGYAKISIQDDGFSVSRANGGTDMFFVDNGAVLSLDNGLGQANILNNLTTARTYTLPDASGTIALTSDIPTQGLTSVGLTMPVAFHVANSPLTSDGTLAVTALGTASQYIRGDGQLATLPSGGGGGSSVFYYLNGSIAASVATYKQLSNTAVIGTGTDFTLTGNGLISQFLTDVGNPNRLQIPSGAWNFEMFFSMSSSGGTPKFYVELLKYDGVTFTTIANNSAAPETISGGTNIDLYLSSLAVPETTLLLTDRLAIRVYIVNSTGGRTATLHTEDNHICQIITTFASGISAINGLNSNNQYLTVGTTGTDFDINSVSETHTFNLPTASATNRGALSSTDWTAFNGKFDLPALTSGSVLFSNGATIAQDNANFFWNDTNNRLGIGTTAPLSSLDVRTLGQGYITIGGTDGRTISSFNNAGAAAVLNFVGGISTTSTYFSNIYDPSTNTQSVRLSSTTISLWSASTERLRVANNGNILIGTIVDQGGKLQVKAPGALSTDIALRVRNSADTEDLFRVSGNGAIVLSSGASFYTLGNNLNFRSTLAGGSGYVIDVQSFNSLNSTSNEQGIGNFNANYAPTSGIGVFNGLKITSIINQTGGANGVTRGLYINPTLTAAADFRAIETTIGKVVLNSTSGNTLIGTTTDIASSKLTVNSTTQGFLPPRMTNAQRIAIATPAVGLCVYCTDAIEGLYINKSTGWTYIG